MLFVFAIVLVAVAAAIALNDICLLLSLVTLEHFEMCPDHIIIAIVAFCSCFCFCRLSDVTLHLFE